MRHLLKFYRPPKLRILEGVAHQSGHETIRFFKGIAHVQKMAIYRRRHGAGGTLAMGASRARWQGRPKIGHVRKLRRGGAQCHHSWLPSYQRPVGHRIGSSCDPPRAGAGKHCPGEDGRRPDHSRQEAAFAFNRIGECSRTVTCNTLPSDLRAILRHAHNAAGISREDRA